MGSIATTTETMSGGDYRWLASARGTEHPVSATLDVSTFDLDGPGVIPSGTPVQFNDDSGLYELADDEDTADTLAGFVWHDVAANTDDVTAAVLTDATIIADNVPGDHDLTDGRYIVSATITPAGS